MNLVFMDTVGLLALWNKDDQWHQAAEKAFTNDRHFRAGGFETLF
jgi:predicted nucleic acid-binding protein